MGFDITQSGEGALGGAATGAALGSVVPGLGTAIGAGLGFVGGGLLGGFGSDKEQVNRDAFNLPGYEDYVNRLQGYQSQMNPAEFRQGQRQLIGQLQSDAAGNGPGQQLVDSKVRQQMERGMASQKSMAAAASPANAAMARRQAAQQGGLLTQSGAQAAAQGGLQAQLAARQQLQGALGQARGQDQGFLGQLLGQEMAASQAQQQGSMKAEMLQQQLNGQPGMGDKLLGAGMGALTSKMMMNANGGAGGRPGTSGPTPSYGGTPMYSGTPAPYSGGVLGYSTSGGPNRGPRGANGYIQGGLY